MRLPKFLSLLITLAFLAPVFGQDVPPWPPKTSRNERVIAEGHFYPCLWSVTRNGHWKSISTRLGQVKPSGKWLGLYDLGNGRYTLQPCVVTVKPILQSEDQPAVYISLTPEKNKDTPLFAVKAGLTPGPVSTVATENPSWVWDGSRYLVNGKPIKSFPDKFTARLNGRKYTIKFGSMGDRYGHGKLVSHGRQLLILEYRGRKQILESWRYTDDGGPTWMGDLDHDGKMDLYVGVAGHGGYFEEHLFLSSWAEPNEIVGRVGGFAASGMP